MSICRSIHPKRFYWRPKRLTLKHNLAIYKWGYWSFIWDKRVLSKKKARVADLEESLKYYKVMQLHIQELEGALRTHDPHHELLDKPHEFYHYPLLDELLDDTEE